MEYHHGVGAGCGGNCDGGVTRFVEFHPVPNHRQFILADGSTLGNAVVMVDDEVEGDDGVAAEDIRGNQKGSR